MLALHDVTKRYGDQLVLKPTSLRLESGRTTVLVGESGCGKSTLLRLMIGLIHPDSGTVEFEGQRLKRSNVLTLRHRMGYVIQEGGLFPHLTAKRNINLMASFLGWNTRRIDDRLKELADLTHFPGEALGRYPAQLSGGQRQRVSLMRALMLDPDVLLLDEPLSALDPLIRSELQIELRDIFRSLDKTVVFVTHDMGEADFIGDSILIIRDGEVLQQGTIRDFLEAPADPFVTRFINAQRGWAETKSPS